MLTTHIYFNGQCKQAIELYKQALHATVEELVEDGDKGLVVHAELAVHGALLIVNDFGNNDGPSKPGGYQLCIRFEDEAALRAAYDGMKDGSETIDELAPTDYSPCTVRFVDRFGARWAFWV